MGLRLGMTAEEVEALCRKRTTPQLVHRGYHPSAQGSEARGLALANVTCGSRDGLTDVAFPDVPNESRAYTIRHRDDRGGVHATDEYVRALLQEFGAPLRRSTETIVHSGYEKVSLEWLVPEDAEDCRGFDSQMFRPVRDVPNDCGTSYQIDVFSYGGLVRLSETTLVNFGDFIRKEESTLALAAREHRGMPSYRIRKVAWRKGSARE